MDELGGPALIAFVYFFLPVVALELITLAWPGWRVSDLYLPQERNSFQCSWASLLRTHKDGHALERVEDCEQSLKTVNRAWKISRSTGTEKVRIAKSHVSPKRNMTPLMLNISRIMVVLLIPSFVRAAVPLVCWVSITITQVKTTTLKTMTARIGARKAPQKASTCDRKQLQVDSL